MPIRDQPRPAAAAAPWLDSRPGDRQCLADDRDADVIGAVQVYVLDNQAGVVLYPGVDQFATLDGWMDLMRRFRVLLYLRTVGLLRAFQRPPFRAPAPTSSTSGGITTTRSGFGYQTSVTLTCDRHQLPDPDVHVRFLVPSRARWQAASGGGTNATWATSAAPSQQLDSSPVRFPATTPRSTPSAARSTPRSTCPATTRTCQRSH